MNSFAMQFHIVDIRHHPRPLEQTGPVQIFRVEVFVPSHDCQEIQDVFGRTIKNQNRLFSLCREIQEHFFLKFSYQGHVEILSKSFHYHPPCMCKGKLNEEMKKLFDEGVNPNIFCSKKITPLHLCSSVGALVPAKRLLENKAAVNCVAEDGTTPLHLASKRQDVEMVDLLFRNGASIFMQDKQGKTALHHACMLLSVYYSEYIEMKFVDVSLKIVKMILEKAKSLKNPTIQEAARRKRWRPELFSRVTLPLVPDLKLVQFINEQDNEGNSALHIAVSNEIYLLTKCLLENGAARYLKNHKGESPYTLAHKRNHFQIIRLFPDPEEDLVPRAKRRKLND